MSTQTTRTASGLESHPDTGAVSGVIEGTGLGRIAVKEILP
jgi:hypothetical protein